MFPLSVGFAVLALACGPVHSFFGHHEHHEPMHGMHHFMEHSFHPMHIYNKIKIPKPIHVPVIVKPIIKTVRVPYKVPVPQPYPVKVKQPYPVKVPMPIKIPYPVPVPYPHVVERVKKIHVPVHIPVKVPYPVREPYPVKQLVPIKIKVPYVIKVKEYAHHGNDYHQDYHQQDYHHQHHEQPAYENYKQHEMQNAYPEPEPTYEAPVQPSYSHEMAQHAGISYNKVEEKAPLYESDMEKQFYQENGYGQQQQSGYGALQHSDDQYDPAYGAASTVQEQKPAEEQQQQQSHGSNYPKSYITETDYKTGQHYGKPANYVQQGLQVVQAQENNYNDDSNKDQESKKKK